MSEQKTTTDPIGIANEHCSDNIAVDDSLGFAPYVDAVASFLVNPKTRPPLTLSVEGAWGSGKSSFMGQLEGKLREIAPDDFRYVWFNAWRHDKEEALWAAFAVCFMKSIASRMAPKEAINAYVELMKRRVIPEDGDLDRYKIVWKITVYALAIFVSVILTVLAYRYQELWKELEFVMWATGITGALLSIKATYQHFYKPAKKAADFLGGAFSVDFVKRAQGPIYEGKISFIEKFHDDFKKVVDAFAPRRKVIIFIDDLDRCETPKAAELLQAINMMIGDNPKLIFIIGMDREKVAAGFAVKHAAIIPHLYPGQENGGGLRYGHEFVEKFIQVPFRIPSPSADRLRDMLVAGLKGNGHHVPSQNIDRGLFKSFVWYLKAIGYLLVAATPKFVKRFVQWLISLVPTFYTFGRRIVRQAWRGWKQYWRDVKITNGWGTVEEKPAYADEPEDEAPSPDPERQEAKPTVVIGDEDEKFHDIVIMVAPIFVSNPRRVKQFLNIFRLRAYIAEATDLFYEPEDSPCTPLTLQKLGKFVAISLRWPSFVDDLMADQGLLERLEEYAIKNWPNEPDEPDEMDTSKEAGWRRVKPLRELLRYGYGSGRGRSAEEIFYDGKQEDFSNQENIFDSRYSLAAIDVRKLLFIHPKVREVESAPQPGSPPQSSDHDLPGESALPEPAQPLGDSPIVSGAVELDASFDDDSHDDLALLEVALSPADGGLHAGVPPDAPYVGKKVSQDQLNEILHLHAVRIDDGGEGEIANLAGADLRRMDLRGAFLVEASLRGADLRKADLWKANLSGSTLDGAKLQGANIADAKMQGAQLAGANLEKAILVGTDLRGAYLQGAELSNAVYSSKTQFPVGFDPEMRKMLRQQDKDDLPA